MSAIRFWERASVGVADAFWRKILARVGGDDGHAQSKSTVEKWSPACQTAFVVVLTAPAMLSRGFGTPISDIP